MWYNVNEFLNESINILSQEVIKSATPFCTDFINSVTDLLIAIYKEIQ